MPGLTLQWRGAIEMSQKLIAMGRVLDVGRPLYEEGQLVMGGAKKRCPVLTGTMRSSGTVEEPKLVGNTVEVVVGFGGASAAYVIKQHEDLSLKHTNGEAKFLEKSLLERASQMAASLATRFTKAFHKAVGGS